MDIYDSTGAGAGYIFRCWHKNANVRLHNCKGYGLTPTAWKDYEKPRRFLTVDNFKNVLVENCEFDTTAGILIAGTYVGDGSDQQTIKILRNRAKNINGLVYGGKDSVQFVQFNFRNAIRHAEIGYNEVINHPDLSAVEDNINIHNSRGQAGFPIYIHNNYIQGAFPFPFSSKEYSGGGIITDGDGGIDICPAYVLAEYNQLVGLGNYHMGLAGGNNNTYRKNRCISAGLHNAYSSGMWCTDYKNLKTTFNNLFDSNVIGIMYGSGRNDISVAEHVELKNNIHLSGKITKSHETAEYQRWTDKLAKNKVVIGI